MAEFAVGRYGANDYRLYKYDGTETEVGTGWDHEPTLRECATALLEYHGSGNQRFSSRDGTLDSIDLSSQWPIPTRDMTLTDETMLSTD